MPSCLYDRIAVGFLYNMSKNIFWGVLLYNTQVGLIAHLRIDFLKKNMENYSLSLRLSITYLRH